MSALRCPDCSAVGKNRELDHDDSCPLMVALEAVIDEDRDWFAAHPAAKVRHRRLTPVERAEFRIFGFEVAARMTDVEVTQLWPGLRSRHPYMRKVGAS